MSQRALPVPARSFGMILEAKRKHSRISEEASGNGFALEMTTLAAAWRTDWRGRREDRESSWGPVPGVYGEKMVD